MDVAALKHFFMWGAILNGGLFLLGFAVMRLAGDWLYRMRGAWYSVSRETFDRVNYAVFAFYKVCILLFFVVPWIALEIVSG